MGKDQQKELRRLEAALMEEDDPERYDPSQPKRTAQTRPAFTASDYRAVNTDHVDVDLQAYSDEVHHGRSGGGMGVLITMGVMVLLSACILVLFKMMGVL